MSVAEAPNFHFENDPGARKRWGGSFLTVLGLHLGVAAVAATWAVPLIAPEAPPPAVLIDMVPTPPAPTKPAEVVPEVKPKELPVLEKAEVVLHKPKPKPKPKIEKRKEPDPIKVPDTRPTPAAPVRAQTPVESRPAPSPNYLSQLYAHLERHKRYPAAAQRRRQTGTVYLRFTIDKEGNVLSSQIERSSGVPSLDKEVAAMIQRADPVPPLPADMHEDRLTLIVPVRFNLKN
jgi:protein TonB